jgi:hypothetical protein
VASQPPDSFWQHLFLSAADHPHPGHLQPLLRSQNGVVHLVLAAALVWRLFTTGGRAMLAMMGGGPDDMADHEQ